MQRRRFIAAAASLGLTGADTPSLRDRASARGLLFGAMVEHGPLAADPAYAAAILHDCAIIVPGIEAKWAATERAAGVFTFDALDAIAAFAATHRLQLRLHNLVWSTWNPAWLAPALAAGQGRAVMARHIDAVAGHLRGRACAWDVVNEAIDTRWPADPDGLVTGGWWHALGPSYVAEAFARAHAADPDARLFINEDWLEYPQSAAKRTKCLRLFERWVRAGVPIHGLGLEAHLDPDSVFDARAYRVFLGDVAALGLIIHVTELDVRDRTLPADIAVRDAVVADRIRHYLDVTLDEPAVRAVLTWAPTDRYLYQNIDSTTRRLDGLPSRGGLLDANLKRKPAWFAVAAALDRAPRR